MKSTMRDPLLKVWNAVRCESGDGSVDFGSDSLQRLFRCHGLGLPNQLLEHVFLATIESPPVEFPPLFPLEPVFAEPTNVLFSLELLSLG
jgi:hypothetical protein